MTKFTINSSQFSIRSQFTVFNNLFASQTQAMKIVNGKLKIAIDGKEIA